MKHKRGRGNGLPANCTFSSSEIHLRVLLEKHSFKRAKTQGRAKQVGGMLAMANLLHPRAGFEDFSIWHLWDSRGSAPTPWTSKVAKFHTNCKEMLEKSLMRPASPFALGKTYVVSFNAGYV